MGSVIFDLEVDLSICGRTIDSGPRCYARSHIRRSNCAVPRLHQVRANSSRPNPSSWTSAQDFAEPFWQRDGAVCFVDPDGYWLILSPSSWA